MEVNPLSIILVKSDSKGGDRLLFRYPTQHERHNSSHESKRRRNPYSLPITEDLQNATAGSTPTDRVLSNLFAVKPELCDQKFELKVNDVRFVGHPIQFSTGVLNGTSHFADAPCSILINIVFALHAHASHSIVKCYYDLSKRLGIALRHEEKRSCYMTAQSRDMIAVHDEVGQKLEMGTDESPYELILQRCSLARDLQKVFDDLCNTGLVYIKVNNWIEVSFCLPHKVHQMTYMTDFVVEPETIDRCLKSIRPYHGLLLLVDANELLESLPPDSSPALARLVHVYSPIKSLQSLASDSDLTLAHVYQLAGHLLYWAKAMVIYPLCKSNIYAIAPSAFNSISSCLLQKFEEKFPEQNLLQELAEFSSPASMNQKLTPLMPASKQETLLQTIAWMLQHRLLLQLHTYVYLMPDSAAVQRQRVSLPSAETSKLLASASFTSEQQAALLHVHATSQPEDFGLFCKFYKKDYLSGRNHLEDIMYFENLRRSQLVCILDKFREVLILCEMEDPAIATFYPHSQTSR